jgi:hypothetical protein
MKKRKFTQEQVDAMNRQLHLVNSNFYYVLVDKHLTKMFWNGWESRGFVCDPPPGCTPVC